MEKFFFTSPDKREDRKVSLEICEAVKNLPEEEGIIMFTFKARSERCDFRRTLEADLHAAGIDTKAKVKDLNGNPRPRFVWLTYGNETSHSQFSYCRHVFLVGVLHRSEADLSAAITGQSANLLREIRHEEVKRAEKTECAHVIYQASARGHMRAIDHGRAGAETIYLIHSDRNVKEILDKVMPGAKWQDWQTVYIQNETLVDRVASRISKYLASVPESVDKISTKRVKVEAGLKDVTKDVYLSAIKAVVEYGFGWVKEGRSFVRAGVYYFGQIATS